MENHSREAAENALKIVSSSIIKCEKMQPKFVEGTSQFSLLRNRIKALKISKCLLEDNGSIVEYSCDDLEKALPPVISIRNKTSKARSKYEEGSTQYKRFSPTIEAMQVCEALIGEELARRNQ